VNRCRCCPGLEVGLDVDVDVTEDSGNGVKEDKGVVACVDGPIRTLESEGFGSNLRSGCGWDCFITNDGQGEEMMMQEEELRSASKGDASEFYDCYVTFCLLYPFVVMFKQSRDVAAGIDG